MSNDKLDKLDERLDRIELIMERNTVHLAEHMRRTAIIEDELKPIQKHVHMVNVGAKILSVLLAVALGAKELGLF